MLHLVLPLFCQERILNVHVKSEIAQSRIGDPSGAPTTPVLAGARYTPQIRHASGVLLEVLNWTPG